MQKKSDLNLSESDVNDIEYLVCHVGLLWRQLINAKIKTLGVSGTEKRVLFCVARYPGLTQIQIANLLDLEPQNLIRVLDKLEQVSWLEKKPSPEDRRAKCLYITSQATKIINQIKAITDDLKPQVIENIDPKKITVLIKELGIMRENLFNQLDKANNANSG